MLHVCFCTISALVLTGQYGTVVHRAAIYNVTNTPQLVATRRELNLLKQFLKGLETALNVSDDVCTHVSGYGSKRLQYSIPLNPHFFDEARNEFSVYPDANGQ